MHLASFLKWIVINLFQSIVERHREFERDLRYRTVETSIFFVLFSIITSLCLFLVIAGVVFAFDMRPSAPILLTPVVMCFTYYVITGVNLMYRTFKQERAELFEKIKNGK